MHEAEKREERREKREGGGWTGKVTSLLARRVGVRIRLTLGMEHYSHQVSSRISEP